MTAEDRAVLDAHLASMIHSAIEARALLRKTDPGEPQKPEWMAAKGASEAAAEQARVREALHANECPSATCSGAQLHRSGAGRICIACQTEYP